VKDKKFIGFVILAVIGLGLAAFGFVLAFTGGEPDNIMQALPFAYIGIGLGAFGGGFAAAISMHIMKKNPKIAKKLVEANDERSVAISNNVKSKLFDFEWIMFAALILFLSVMLADPVVVLVFIGAFFLRIIMFVYLLNKYHKEM